MFRRNPSLNFLFALSILSVLPLEAHSQQLDREVARLAENPAVAEAFRVIEALEPTTQADLISLTEIPAPPFMEEIRGKAYAELLRAAGADSVLIDEVGNVLAFRGGTQGGRTVVLGGHMDTVFPEGTDVSVKIRGDTLFAPGVGG